MIRVFGFLFNDISIRRLDGQGNIIKTIKVPLAYAPKEKYIAHLQQADSTKTAISQQLPRISFEYTAITPDPSRKLTTTGKNYAVDALDSTLIKFGYHPVPFNFDLELNVFTKFAEDTTQIIEQILPFFTPDFTLSVKENTDLNIIRDIPVTFTGMSQQDTYEGDFTERRAIISTLTFEMKGYIYGPTKSAKTIKDVTVGIRDTDTEEILESLNVFIDPVTAGPNDDFGFTETISSSSTFFLVDENNEFIVDEFNTQITS